MEIILRLIIAIILAYFIFIKMMSILKKDKENYKRQLEMVQEEYKKSIEELEKEYDNIK